MRRSGTPGASSARSASSREALGEAAGEDDSLGMDLFDEATPDQWAPAPVRPAEPLGPWGGYGAGPKKGAKLKGKGAATVQCFCHRQRFTFHSCE